MWKTIQVKNTNLVTDSSGRKVNELNSFRTHVIQRSGKHVFVYTCHITLHRRCYTEIYQFQTTFDY